MGGWTSGYVHDRPVLSHPDWSQLRIRRLQPSGEEEVFIPKVAELLKQITPDTDPEEIKKADVRLQRGDIVELPRRADASGEWTGFEPAMRTLLTKVLSTEIVLMREGVFQNVPVTYLPPAFVPTRLGTLPLVAEAPKEGQVSELLAGAVVRSVLKGNYQISKVVRLPEELSEIPGLSLRYPSARERIYLCPDDQIEVVKLEEQKAPPSSPVPVQRRRVLPAPSQ